jgi:sugar lactone lactonase YvrE
MLARMTDVRVVLDGLGMGESARWRDGHVWFCDWLAGEVIRVDGGTTATVVARVGDGMPFCVDFAPDGSMVLLDGPRFRLVRDNDDVVDLSGIDGEHPWNDIAVDARGNAFVNNIGYDFPGGEERPGLIAVVTPDGRARVVADGLLFPNGMAVAGETLIVAESHAGRLTAFDIGGDGSLDNRRVWAALPGAAPDGICVDRSGAVWYADVPHQRCQRVREGGEVLGEVRFDRGAFDCALSGDGRTLYAVTADWSDPRVMFAGGTGQLVAADLSEALQHL